MSIFDCVCLAHLFPIGLEEKRSRNTELGINEQKNKPITQ